MHTTVQVGTLNEGDCRIFIIRLRIICILQCEMHIILSLLITIRRANVYGDVMTLATVKGTEVFM